MENKNGKCPVPRSSPRTDDVYACSQLQQTKEFAKPAELISVTSFVVGQNDLKTFRKFSDHVNNLEELNSYGLTDSEIELLLDYEKGKEYIFTKHRNICKTILEEDINRILTKISDAKSKKCALGNANDSVSRHVKEIALCVKPNSEETKLYNFALSCSSVEKPSTKPVDHPINQLVQLERDHFGYLNSSEILPSLKKRRKKARKYLDRTEDSIILTVPDVQLSNSSNGKKNSKWDLKHVPIENKFICKSNEEKVYTCNNKVYYTIRNNEIVKLNSPSVDEEDIDVQTIIEKKLTEEEIRNIPRFQNYQRGTLSKVLYIKNLANGIKEEDLKRLIDSLCREECKFATYRLLNGKMKGQAFVTFNNVHEATIALEAINGCQFKGKPIIVQYGRST
ncbi:uncharacterized protein CBL_03952 [Carabus blaptoides fortunei]